MEQRKSVHDFKIMGDCLAKAEAWIDKDFRALDPSRFGHRNPFLEPLIDFDQHIVIARRILHRRRVAAQLGVAIAGCTIIEDSAVGATGALASGARVIGLVAGSHCLPGHEERLRSLGVRDIAHSFDDVSRLLNLG